jgi:SAM-dependent methyltransferase
LEYFALIFLLKTMFLIPGADSVYRFSSGIIGPLIRGIQGLPKDYILRAEKILSFAERYGIINNAEILEIGSGWVMWESLVLSLFYDIKINLFDIYDNRQLPAIKKYLSDFSSVIACGEYFATRKTENTLRRLQCILDISSLTELDNFLSINFFKEPFGSLAGLHPAMFDTLISINVLEHVKTSMVEEFVADMYRILKPGGYCQLQIDLGDHFADHCRKGVSRKKYLQFSDRIWGYYFENGIKYFNRIQRPRWLSILRHSGFSVVEEKYLPCALDNFKIARQYSNLSRADLECRFIYLVLRKDSAI